MTRSVVEQALGGQPDERVIDVCRREGRALVTLDLDFSNILAYPPAEFAGVIVLRLANQAHVTIEPAIRRMVELVSQEPEQARFGLSRSVASEYTVDFRTCEFPDVRAIGHPGASSTAGSDILQQRSRALSSSQ